MTSPWLTPGIEALLCELHALSGNETLTMGQIKDVINRQFGTELTRNAIIGRCHRLKLPKRPSPLPPQSKGKTMPEEIKQPSAPVVVPRNGVSIYELERDSCRFVLDDVEARPPFSYCGKQTRDGGSSWCEAHHKRVYSGGKW